MLVLRVEAAQYTVSEGSGSVEVGVVKEGISEEPTTVMLTTSDGTALGEGRDMHILLEDIRFQFTLVLALLIRKRFALD